MVMVYRFQVWDYDAREMVVQPFKCPAWRVQEIGGELIDGTGEDVPEAMLDEEARYDRARHEAERSAIPTR